MKTEDTLFDTGKIAREHEGDDFLPQTPEELTFSKDMFWYWKCVERTKLLYSGNKLCEIRKIEDPPSQDAAYSTKESIFEAFWRTMMCNIDALGKRPTDLSKPFQVHHEAYLDLGHLRNTLVNMELRAQFTFFSALTFVYTSRRGFFTTGSLIGWAPASTQIGDFVCIISGARLPHIIRQCTKDPDFIEFELIGEAYARDIMDGEAFMDLETSPVRGAPLKTIVPIMK